MARLCGGFGTDLVDAASLSLYMSVLRAPETFPTIQMHAWLSLDRPLPTRIETTTLWR